MKVSGKAVTPAAEIPFVVPRIPKEDSIVFKLSPVRDHAEFTKLIREPQPPVIMKRGIRELNVNSPVYKQQMVDYNKKLSAWIILKCMNANNGHEGGTTFETVKWEDSDTWVGWTDEAREAGLSEGELVMLINEINKVCGVDAAAYQEAREDFLSGVLGESPTLSLTDGVSSIASGEPVNGGT